MNCGVRLEPGCRCARTWTPSIRPQHQSGQDRRRRTDGERNPAPLFDLLSDVDQLRLCASHDGDRSTFAGQRERHASARSLTASGDNRHSSFENSHASLPAKTPPYRWHRRRFPCTMRSPAGGSGWCGAPGRCRSSGSRAHPSGGSSPTCPRGRRRGKVPKTSWSHPALSHARHCARASVGVAADHGADLRHAPRRCRGRSRG